MDIQTLPGRYTEPELAKIYPVILAGGSGTRLWPLSRADRPKQFLRLVSERSLLQETAMRGLLDTGFADPIVVCNEEHRFLVADQLDEVGVKPQAVLLEPVSRNTAPAIAVAALWLLARDPHAVMLVQPADHVIGSPHELLRAVSMGLPAAHAGRLVTFGIKPDHAATGYGYIQVGSPLDDPDGALAVERFVEKPDRETAGRFVDSGEFYWNSGLFLLSARAYVDELFRIDSGMVEACRRSLSTSRCESSFVHLHGPAFTALPSLSIDHAVMEHTERAAVVLVDMHWSDVGTWLSLHQAGESDEAGTLVIGDVRHEGVRNCYLRTDGRLLVAAGLEDVTVVATDDAVLVCGRDSAAAVSRLLEGLRRENRSEPRQHSTSYRPWGTFRTIDAGGRFQVKRITVNPGAKISLQLHYHRAEHWVVVRGTAIVQTGEDRQVLHENQSVYIAVGQEHRIENPGRVALEFIEVQCGGYLGEDDIVRISDSYGRA